MQLVPKPAQFVETTPDPIDVRFLKAAQKLDARITTTVERVYRDWTALGEMFDEARTKGYHTALGIPVFEDYIKARLPDRNGKTQVFEAMRVFKLLVKDETVSREDVRGMTQGNATALAQMKKANIPITATHIVQAKTLSAAEFKKEVFKEAPALHAKAESEAGRHVPGGAVVLVRRQYEFNADTDAMMQRCAAIAVHVTREDVTLEEGKNPNPLPFTDRWFQSMCQEYEATYGAEYEESLAASEAEGRSGAAKEKERMRTVPDDEGSIDGEEDGGYATRHDEEILTPADSIECPTCHGSGERSDNVDLPCLTCEGEGTVTAAYLVL